MQGLRVIWQAYLDTFLGPLWMAILPETKIFKKPKHQLLQIFFTWFRLAWPGIYDTLHETIEIFEKRLEEKEVKPKKGEYLDVYNLYCYKHLRNLDMLGSYSVPVIADFAIRSKLKTTQKFMDNYKKMIKIFMCLSNPTTYAYIHGIKIQYMFIV